MRILLAIAPLTFFVACPPPKKEEPLPPPGLAGATGSASGGITLPGLGVPVAEPSGTANPRTELPPGHPPIDEGLPPNHPPVDGVAVPPSANASEPQITGTVAEVLEVPEYTYMRVKTSGGGEEWVAVAKTQIAVGDVVTVSQHLLMENFASRSLNRTFPRLVMGMLIGAPKKP